MCYSGLATYPSTPPMKRKRASLTTISLLLPRSTRNSTGRSCWFYAGSIPAPNESVHLPRFIAALARGSPWFSLQGIPRINPVFTHKNTLYHTDLNNPFPLFRSRCIAKLHLDVLQPRLFLPRIDTHSFQRSNQIVFPHYYQTRT